MNTVELCKEIDRLLDADFFEISYGKQHALMQLESSYTEGLITDAQVEAFIRFNEMKERSPKVFFHGHRVNLSNDSGHNKAQYDHIMRLHSGGASLICNQTQKVSSAISYLTNFLEQKFEGKSHGNLYITPAKMTAFNPHYDKHDVIVIQLRGSKKWSFYAPPNSTEDRNVFNKVDLDKTEELILKSGSILYVPHGLIHSAESTNEASWHITLGITGYYWKDVLKDLIDQAANPENLSLLNRFPVNSGQQEQLQNDARALLETMKSHIDFSSGLRKFDKNYPGIGSFRFDKTPTSFTEPETIDDDQFFSFNKKSQITVDRSKERLSLTAPFRKEKLHIKISLLRLIEHMQTSDKFSPRSIKGEESIRDIKLFLSFLQENGFIKTIG